MNEQDRSDQAGGSGAQAPPGQQQNHPKTRCERAAEYYRCAEAYIRRHGKTVEVISTAIIAAFTIVIGFTSKWQWQATKRSVSVAEQSMKVSREMIQAIERPWVLFDQSPPDDPSTPDKESNWATEQALGIHVVNFGRGPAMKVRSAIWVADGWFWAEVLPDGDWKVSGENTVPPGKALLIRYDWKWLPPQSRRPKTGDNTTAIVFVTYDDQFGRPHQTIFCAYATVANSPDNVLPCQVSNYTD